MLPWENLCLSKGHIDGNEYVALLPSGKRKKWSNASLSSWKYSAGKSKQKLLTLSLMLHFFMVGCHLIAIGKNHWLTDIFFWGSCVVHFMFCEVHHAKIIKKDLKWQYAMIEGVV